MLRLYSLLLMGMMLASFGIAQAREEHRWENVESLRVGQKLEVTTTQLRTIQGTYLNSSEAAIRLKTPEGEVSLMREEVFRVKSQEGKRKQNILVGVVGGLFVFAFARAKFLCSMRQGACEITAFKPPNPSFT